MRTLQLLQFTFILFILMAYLCTACKKSFPGQQNLTQHRRSCNKFAALVKDPDTSSSASGKARRKAKKKPKPLKCAKVPRLDIIEPEVLRAELCEEFDEDIDLPHAEVEVEAPTAQEAGPSTTAPESQPAPPLTTRSGRVRRPPKTFQDCVPSLHKNDTWLSALSHLWTPTPKPRTPTPEPSPEPSPELSPTPEPIFYNTAPDTFGVFKWFMDPPARDLDDDESADNCIDAPTIAADVPVNTHYLNPMLAFSRSAASKAKDWFAPFLNATVFRLVHWVYTGPSAKSHGEINRLVREVLLAPDFRVKDLEGFDMQREEKRLDQATLSLDGLLACGFKPASVDIFMPRERVKYASVDKIPKFTVDGFISRQITEIIKGEARDDVVRNHTFTSHERYAKDPFTGQEERIFSELYECNAMAREMKKIRAQPRNPADPSNVEYGIMPICLSSDDTLMVNFGTKSMKPIYMLFRSLSKYVSGRLNAFTIHHLAYVPSKLPPDLKTQYKRVYGVYPSDRIMRLCRGDLMQAIWMHILDAEFLEAYEHGILVECGDGVTHRLFPRFFTYSADYPERCALACIRFLGQYPCPRCYTEKKHIHELGGKRDRKRRDRRRRDNATLQADIAKARRDIFLNGCSTESAVVQAKTASHSLHPIRSAFSLRLACFGFNFYSMFTSDVMHEVELGWWKQIYMHILRILEALGGQRIYIFNDRGTIRKFRENVSEMKQMAARDYEDILLCIIPCLEGLLPAPLEHVIFDLIFIVLLWHGLAKLRMHTETTVDLLDGLTTHLGDNVRKFKRAVDPIDTRELGKEAAARIRREKARLAKEKGGTKAAAAETSTSESVTYSKRNIRKFNDKTFKIHNPLHTVEDIKEFGPTEIFSTQW
ncbi:hypothetical protein EIP86_011532, partial [Pleurotus ostreatoroseus]